jgi:glycosyltransferase involved in cell wall biosynthesis
MSKPLVSIIMNCYNGEKFLKETLESVYAQTYTNWEVIFWDNLSTDNSKQIACSFDDKIKYYRGEFFLPLGAARNMAISKAQGEFIAILDCDDLWYPSKLLKQISVFIEFPEIDLVYSNYTIINEDGVLESNNTNLKIGHICNAFKPIFLHELTIPWPTIVMKKDIVINVGGFSNYKSAEDFDLLLKISQKSQFYFVDEFLATYRIHINQLSTNFELTKNEIFQIYNYWEVTWSEYDDLDAKKNEWLKIGKKQICYISGLRALIQNKSASTFFKEAIKYKGNIKLYILYFISYIPIITFIIRKYYFAKK